MSLPALKSSRERVAIAAPLALAVWLVWCAVVVFNYFTFSWDVAWREPSAELFPAPYWREAVARLAQALFGCAAVMLAAWTLGSLILRAARDALIGPSERILVGFGLGLAALSFLCLGLASAGLYRAPIVRVLVLVLAVFSVSAVSREAAGLRRWWKRPTITVIDAVFLACATAACGLAWLAALAPEKEYDALWYHLWLPVRWLAAGRPVDIVHEYISLYPLTWELLYGLAMTLGGSGAAKLLHFICLPALGVIAGMLTTRWFPSARASAGAALAVAVPLTIWEAGTAYIDLALACYVALSAYALTRYVETRGKTWLIFASLLMGAALAIKHLALLSFAIVAFIFAVVDVRRGGVARAFRAVALFAILALLVPAPWYLRAWRASGNPVFPDLYSVFGARPPERWDEGVEAALGRFKARFGRERTPQLVLALPWDVTMHGARYAGTLGPVFLLLVPVALIGALPRASRRGPVALVAGAVAGYLAIWASPLSSMQMRFLVPLIPLLAALSAEGLRILPAPASLLVGALLVLNLPPFTEWHESDRSRGEGWLTHTSRAVPLQVLIGAESEQHYLRRSVPSYAAWAFIDSHVPPEARVLTFSGGDHLYTRADRIWSDSVAARPATWDLAAGREREARLALARMKITHVLFDRRQLEGGEAGQLAVGSAAMRQCCLEKLYEDGRFAVYRVR